MPDKSKKIILIDGNALMHRAYHALPPLTTKKGELVNAVYGFTSVLLKVIKELKPDYMACAFDVAGGTFRDKVYKEYKAGRIKPGQEFYDQIPRIKEVVKALNIPIIEKQGFEADDIIGTIANRNWELEIRNWKTIIITGDLDTLQLVNKNTEVYTLRKGIKDTVLYDEKAVEERYELKPKQIIDFKSLRGDPSDNIPGVKGIGEKGAIELLRNFGSIEKLYKAIAEDKEKDLIKPKIKEKLISQKKEALMSKELATIKRDVDIEFDLKKCVWGDYNKEKLNKLFQELEFYSLLDRVSEANHNKAQGSKLKAQNNNINKKYVSYIILDTGKKIDEFLTELKKQKRFIFQTRSSNDDAVARDLNGFVFSWDKNRIYYIPLALAGDELNLFNISEIKDISILSKLKPILENSEYKKIGYFFKRDLEALYEHDINIKGLELDIMLAAYLLDPGKRDYSKDKIIFDYLGHKENIDIEKENEIKEKIKNASEIAKISHFFELYEILKNKLRELKMKNLFYKIEMPLIKTLVEIETNGVKLDIKLLKIISGELTVKIRELEEKIRALSKDDKFNINSSQQLSRVLFEKMKLPTEDIRKTQTSYSVAAPELEKLKDKHIIITFISEYKELVKLKNTYVDVLPKLINKKTGRLHTTFHQTVTATGRLSSSDPNLQNIPIKTEVGRKIRKAFIAEPQRKLLSADYSQIELRIVAMIANDKKMKEIFNKDQDIHAATAAEVNQVPLDEVTAEMRRAAKALNFGVIYGMSVFSFAQSAGIDRNRAKKFIDEYMEKFSGVAKYIEKAKDNARKKGYAETLFGRRRYLPEINSSNAIVRNSAERMAINMPIQGTAADIIKIAMIKIDEWINKYNNRNKEAIKLLLQVHDELLFSVKEEFVEETAKEIKEIMENRSLEVDGQKIDFPVPIKVDLKAGDNWEEMERLAF